MLTGNKIRLRALEPSDLDLLYEWENNGEIWKISDTIQPFSRYALEQYVNSVQDVYTQKQLRFIIEHLEDKKAIGCIDLFDFDPIHRRIGIGILIANDGDRQKGYAKEAIKLVLEYCKTMLECHQVYCNVLESNSISLRLFSNFGFETAGVKKDWIRIGSEMHDEIMLQLILD